MMERGHRVGGIFDPKTDALLGVLAILGSYGEGIVFVVPNGGRTVMPLFLRS